MKTIDWLLNIAALIFWLRWLSFFSVPSRAVVSLAIVVKPAEPSPSRSFYPLLIIGLILFGKAIFFHYGGAIVKWNPTLDLIAISISFKSDFFIMALLFSFFSFILFLIIFYFWLWFFSVINYREELDLYHRKVIQHLGIIGRLPAFFRLLAPFAISAFLWCVISPLLSKLGVIVKPPTFSKLIIQSGLISLGLVFSLKYIVIVICALFMCYNYIYLGVHPFWSYIGITGRRLLKPLRWIRLGPLDLSPLAMSVLIVWISLVGERWFPLFYQRFIL